MNFKEWEVNHFPHFFYNRRERMFEMRDKMKFININQEYIKALHEVCPEVFYKEKDYEGKPYIGILVNKENRKYVIPLSSAKNKHKTWKNIHNDCFLVYEFEKVENLGTDAIWVKSNEADLVKHIFSVLDIKKMIPIKEGLYSVVDMKENTNDPVQVKKYKDLLNKEIRSIRISFKSWRKDENEFKRTYC